VGGGCPAGWGRKFPVGDPLTPGGGPGRAELRLEEEEEEEETEEEPKDITEERGKVVSEAPPSSAGVWELFGHLLVEDLTVGGRISLMKCIRCGFAAPLTELKAFKKRPCRQPEAPEAKEEAAKEARPEKGAAPSIQRRCENCGREGATATLCDECAEIFERYSEAARPAPLRGRGGIKPPSVPGVDGWAWVSSLTTFFPFRKLEGGGREWWCPACKKTFKRLIDATDHFRESHPTLASRGWYEEFDAKTRRARLRNWQGWVDEQQLQLILEPEVKPQ
jgi:uncharacterized C2H2 Zn-finger protein